MSMKWTAMIAIVAMSSSARAGLSARQRTRTVSDARFGIVFRVPADWVVEVHSAYEVVARGKPGGFETHAVVFTTPEKAVRDYFVDAVETAGVHERGRWTCASGLSRRAAPATGVVVCAEQLRNGHALMASLKADVTWLQAVGGETFLRRLVADMKGFRADDD
jgi:hypothetical protein